LQKNKILVNYISMPYKYNKKRYIPKYARKKKVFRRKTRPRQLFKFSRGLSRSVIPFTRERETYFHLSDLTGKTTPPFKNFVHTTDGGVVGQIRITLADLGDSHTDFTNLFRQYKLNYIKIIFYPAANTVTSGSTRDEGGNYSNNQVLIRTKLNRTGISIGAGNTISEWSQVQAKKQWMLATDKPTSIGCRLSQLSPVAGGESYPPGASDEEYSVVKPRYVSTNHTEVLHQGLDIRFDSLNGEALSQGDQIWPQFRIVAKVYLTCKGVA
jgi:hypothetical protein